VLGNLSTVGDLYAELLGAKFLAADKTTHPLPVNCSGLDLSALLAAVVEQHHDGRGIIWPDSVAPFAAQLVSLPTAEAAAESLYQRLRGAGVDVLWDDRTESAGVKFGDADLIGNPVRLVMSRRTGDKIEWKARGAEQVDLVEVEEAVERLRLD
jgi:prolyl-tRNA synthetase